MAREFRLVTSEPGASSLRKLSLFLEDGEQEFGSE